MRHSAVFRCWMRRKGGAVFKSQARFSVPDSLCPVVEASPSWLRRANPLGCFKGYGADFLRCNAPAAALSYVAMIAQPQLRKHSRFDSRSKRSSSLCCQTRKAAAAQQLIVWTNAILKRMIYLGRPIQGSASTNKRNASLAVLSKWVGNPFTGERIQRLQELLTRREYYQEAWRMNYLEARRAR